MPTAQPPRTPRTLSRENCGCTTQRKGRFADLHAQFHYLQQHQDPRDRGYQLESLFADVLKRSGLDVWPGLRRNGGSEQVDVAFRFEGWYYLTECRWHRERLSARSVDGLSGQVRRSGKQTMGLLLAINGWSDNVPGLLQQNQDKSILLMDGDDLDAVLAGRVGMRELLSAKLAALNLRGQPFLSAQDATTHPKSNNARNSRLRSRPF